MRVKGCIYRPEEHCYFLRINIYTNTDSTNAGPFLPFIILFSLFVQDDAKQTHAEAGDKKKKNKENYQKFITREMAK